MSMTAPPVSGGMLAVLGILMAQLGIPDVGLGVAALLGIVTDFPATGSRIGIIHSEVILQANKLNMLDRDMLASKNNFRGTVRLNSPPYTIDTNEKRKKHLMTDNKRINIIEEELRSLV